MPLFGGGTSGSGVASGLITPTISGTMGTTKTIDLAGAASAVFQGTLDQTSCAITYTGFTVNRYSEQLVTIVGSTGKTITHASTITWDDGNAPVVRTTGSGTMSFLVYSYDGTNLRGSHGQRVRTITYAQAGTIAVGTGLQRFYLTTDARVVAVRASAGTAPTGAAMVFDVNKNGTTLYTTQANRPTVAISGNTVSATLPDVTLFAPGDYLSIDFDVVGSSIAGGDISVQIDVIEAY